MQSCSVHHCVLFLLTLTFTTDPGSAVCEFPIYAKLHQSVTLPCSAQCSGWAKWSLDSKRDVVFARCDQTSCRSEKGYEMSHDQFKRGDLSLTITDPDYSKRKTYTCECDLSDYTTVNLRISTVSSPVQMSPGEDLKLDFSVPESVEVIYRGSVLSDDVQICTVTDRTLQCNTEYTPRTSLSHSEITLRNMWRGESGTYTIRNLDYKEDIRVYAVSVSGLTSGETAGIVIPVLLLLVVLVIAGVMYYKKKAAEWEVKPLKEEVQKLIKRGLVKNTPGLLTVANLIGINPDLKKVREEVEEAEEVREEVVKEIIDLEEKYREDRTYSEHITWFCNEKRRGLGLRTYSSVDLTTLSPEAETEQFNLEREKVNSAVEKVMEALEKASRAINHLEEKYSEDDINKQYVTWFCDDKRRELGSWKNLTRDSVQAWLRKSLASVIKLIISADKPGAEREKVLREVDMKLNALEQEYSRDRHLSEPVRKFCNIKRRELQVKRNKSVTEDVQNHMKAVDELIKQALNKHGAQMALELNQVEKKINALRKENRGNADYLERLRFKTEELEVYRQMFALQVQSVVTEEVKSLKEAVYKLISQDLHKPAEEVKKEITALEQQNSVDEEIVRFFCKSKREELEVCRKVYGSQESEARSLRSQMEGVTELIKQAQAAEDEEEALWKVEEKINELKLKYSWDRNYSKQANLFCDSKRLQLDVYRNLLAIQMGYPHPVPGELMVKAAEMGKILQDLHEVTIQNRSMNMSEQESMCSLVRSHLRWIDSWCSDQIEVLHKSKQKAGHGEGDNMIRNMETHVNGFQLWCVYKQNELERYRKILKPGDLCRSNVDLRAAHGQKGGETDKLLHEV